MESFFFRLNPDLHVFEGDSEVMLAFKEYEGDFCISWMQRDGSTSEIECDAETVMKCIAEKEWLMC